MQNRMTVSEHGKRVLSLILICAFLILMLSGCVIHLNHTEASADSSPIGSASAGEEETPAIPAGVPSDASVYNGHYYKIYYEKLDWDIARQECINLGGHLATITDEAEQKFIDELNSGSKQLWIGGFLVDNQWRWVTEEAFEYTNWGEGEPNNSSNMIPDETNVAVWPSDWNDLNNASREQSGYICEWDGIPDIAAEAAGNP